MIFRVDYLVLLLFWFLCGRMKLLYLVLFPAFGIITTKATSVNYAHPIIYLFLGGFLLAIAVEKTQLHIFYATPPNAIAMSSGVVNVKDMIRYGIVLNLLGIFFIVIVAELFWKAVL